MEDQERLSLEQELLELLKKRQGVQRDTLEDSRDFANVLQSQTKEIREQVSQRNKLNSLSRSIVKQAEDLFSITKDELGTIKNINDLAKKRQELEKTQIQLSSFLNTIKTGNAEIDNDINNSIKDQIINTQKLLGEVKELETTSNKVANNFGVKTFGAISDVAKKIPGLNRFAEPFNNAAEAARKASQQNIGIDKYKQLRKEGMGVKDALDKAGVSAKQVKLGKTSPFLTGIKSIGPSLAKAFGPAAIILELVKAFIQLDNLAGDTAKSMGISYSAATQLNSEFNTMANDSNNIFVTTKGINESFNQINQALGTNGRISKEILITQTELVKQAGYSVEAATAISKLSLATGKPAKEITTQFLGQAKALNLTNKTAINEKQLLESIAKASKSILVTFADQPAKLAEAAYETKKLGLELDQIQGVQSALLDIESSIAAEFEAEVITGKQLNLERARYYALTNNISGLAKELSAQGITQAKFGKMTVIEQEAVAKAMGMSKDTMSGMLMEQAAISKLSSLDGKNAKEKYENAVRQYGVEKANQMLGDDTLAQQMQSASMQDKFNASVEKLKEVFVGVMSGLMPIFDVFSEIFKIIGPIVNLLMKQLMPSIHLISLMIMPIIEGLQWIFTLGKSGFSGTQNAAKNFGKSLGNTIQGDILKSTGVGKEMGAVGEWMGVKETVEDGIAPASKGPFTITDSYGATNVTTKGDGLVVSPNINKSSNQSPSIDYDKMAQAMSKVSVNTNLDGVRVSSELQKAPMGMATRKI
jgi:plasmid maintenance system antidote protein VapI